MEPRIAPKPFFLIFFRCASIHPFGLHFGSLLDHFGLPKWCFGPLLAPQSTILRPFASLFGNFYANFGTPDRGKQISCTKTRCLLDLGNFGHISLTSRPKTDKINFITSPVTKRPYQKQGGGGVAERYSIFPPPHGFSHEPRRYRITPKLTALL